jgi:beta-galactosidase
MFPAPSYASSAFHDEVRSWYQALAKAIKSSSSSQRVVALQVDSKVNLHLRGNVFDGDYHPEALQWWHEISGGAPVPRSFDPGKMPLMLKWAHFREEYWCRSMSRLVDALNDVGLGELARFHNLAPTMPGLANPPKLEQCIDGVCGINVEPLATGLATLRQHALYLSASSRLPIAPEVSIGNAPWFPPGSEASEQNMLLTALAAGIRGFGLYMAVERERWAGGVFNEAGGSERSAWLTNLLHTLRSIEFHTLRKRAPIALIFSRAEARAGIVSCALPSAAPVLAQWLDLGAGGHVELSRDDDARNSAQWFRAIQHALQLAEVPYQIIDEECLHGIGQETKAVILPTLRRVEGATWAALHALAQAGVQVVIGPETPTEDECGETLGADQALPSGAGMLEASVLHTPDELAGALLDIAGELDDLWIAPDNAHVECSAFYDDKDHVRALFVSNTSDALQEAQVNVPEESAFQDALSGEVLHAQAGVLSLSLNASQLRLLVVR